MDLIQFERAKEITALMDEIKEFLKYNCDSSVKYSELIDDCRDGVDRFPKSLQDLLIQEIEIYDSLIPGRLAKFKDEIHTVLGKFSQEFINL